MQLSVLVKPWLSALLLYVRRNTCNQAHGLESWFSSAVLFCRVLFRSGICH